MPAPSGPRPQFHFTARRGWVNDPLALTWHDGRYHLFFQYLPDAHEWTPECHWGHATSVDLLAWEQASPVLSPGDGDGGCWSGSLAVPDAGPARLFYTSVTASQLDLGRIRTAGPQDDGWAVWRKGPVVVEAPPHEPVTTFRDPYVLRDGQRWRMVVGAGLAGGTAALLGWSSDDLQTWRYDGRVVERPGASDGVWTGEVWECPQLFPLDGRHVLVVSVWDRAEGPTTHYVAAAVGSYADGRFHAERWQRLTYGPSCYAPSTFLDRDGRRGLIHWLREVRDRAAGWAGGLSVPHILRLEDGHLVADPHPAVAGLRATGDARPDDGLEVTWTPAARDGTSLRLLAGRDTAVELFVVDGVLTVTVPGGPQPGPWHIPSVGPVRLLVDGPVLEVFTSGGVLAAPLPPTEGLRPVAPDGAEELVSWPLRPATVR